MTITPRIGVSAIEFIRSKDGSEEKLVETVSLEVCQWLMALGANREELSTWCSDGPRNYFNGDTVLTILRQEAEK